MKRTLFVIVLLGACGPSSTHPAVGNLGSGAGRPGSGLAVQLGAAPDDGDQWTSTLQPTATSHFPAVSADGTTIVDLVQDAEDFSGIPIATVMFWTKSGVAASFQLVSTAKGEPDGGKQAKQEATVIAQANAKLAATSWRPLDAVTGATTDDGPPQELTFPDGMKITLDQVKDKFPAPGSSSQAMGGGGCGEITGLARGIGSREIGFVVLMPTVMLGGDDCMGTPSAEQAIVVPAT